VSIRPSAARTRPERPSETRPKPHRAEANKRRPTIFWISVVMSHRAVRKGLYDTKTRQYAFRRFRYSVQKLDVLFFNKVHLLQRVRPVQGVLLFQAEDGIRDDAAELAFTGAVFHAGGEHHVFFNQNAADVVRTELQADLADFYSRGEPARLDVINVVEIQPADRERFQIIDSRGLLHFFAERGIFRGEHPQDKRGEPAGIFLNAANALEVIDAVAQFFATMMFGCGEELRHRVNHFERIRRIQEDTGGFIAVIPVMFAAGKTAPRKKAVETTADQ